MTLPDRIVLSVREGERKHHDVGSAPLAGNGFDALAAEVYARLNQRYDDTVAQARQNAR